MLIVEFFVVLSRAFYYQFHYVDSYCKFNVYFNMLPNKTCFIYFYS